MSQLEEYTAKAAASLAEAEAATTDRDRAHHRRAHSIWRRLIANIGEAEARAAMKPPPKPKAEKVAIRKSW
ncbi:MAG: hypothetical protein JWM38_941 [Sphingomonas bacterium]|jgi:NAD-dependent oxidoreductase involved in siderophore biosynthesis|nr:hypothetical protein [Sphingomonas bacterium]MDB5683323.1 hypothetical protein [Sphingomonas bacterium]MDB5717514.1 hypothetical protein [Sphingomonas bacterium]